MFYNKKKAVIPSSCIDLNIFLNVLIKKYILLKK